METELFGGARLKVKWAEEHIRKLNSAIIELLDFVEKDSYSLSFEKDPNTGNHRLIFKTNCNIPDTIPLIIGDTIHNLRTALDHIAYELPRLFGGNPDEFTKFPFRKSREELEAAINGGTIKCISPDLKALFLDTIKPYTERGNNALCALHTLDIADKHHLLIPVVGITELNHITMTIGEAIIEDLSLGVQGGEINILEIAGGITSEDVTFQNHGQPTFCILFGEVKVFKGKPVVPTLHYLSQLVSNIIEKIREKCPALS